MEQNDEKTVAAEKAVETETTQTSSPQVETPSTEEKTVQTTEEVSDEPQGMTEEQRKAFQEKRLEIKQLKEEKAARERAESAFEVFRPKPVAQPGYIDINAYRDPISGEVDLNGYNTAVNQKLHEAQSLAFQASSSVDDRLDELQAKQKYPELFADPDIEQEIADRWFASKMRGEKATVINVAERVAKRFEKAVSKAEKIGAEKALSEVTPKEQAAMAASGQTSAPARQQTSDEELERLRQQSRGKGRESDDAIVQRLKGIPWQ